MRPEDALSEAAKILIKHLTVIGGSSIDSFDSEPDIETVGAKDLSKNAQLYEKPIEELDLSVRVFNSLKRTGITTIGDVLDMLDRGPDAMLAIRNFGEKSLDELVEKLREKNYLKKEGDSDAHADE
jgi:DNA-directed RNA polymerase subunit alpha